MSDFGIEEMNFERSFADVPETEVATLLINVADIAIRQEAPVEEGVTRPARRRSGNSRTDASGISATTNDDPAVTRLLFSDDLLSISSSEEVGTMEDLETQPPACPPRLPTAQDDVLPPLDTQPILPPPLLVHPFEEALERRIRRSPDDLGKENNRR